MHQICTIFLFLILLSCNSQNNRIVTLSNLEKDTSFCVESRGNSTVTFVTVNIKGDVNGEYAIVDRHFAAGKIDTTFKFEYYGKRYCSTFKPITAKKGKLTLSFDF